MPAELPFIDQVSRPGMLHLEIVRSTIPRGNVESIESEELPEGCFLIRRGDIPGADYLSVFGSRMPLLSEDEILFEGQAICIIAARDRKLLSHCRRKVLVNYQTDYSILSFEPFLEEQVVDTVVFEKGNVYKGTDSQYQIIEAEYSTTPESHITRAPLGALAYLEEERIVIEAPTHWPHHVRSTVAEVLGVKKQRIKVLQTASSPAYGEKVVFPSQLAAYAALAAEKSGKPARILLSPRETYDYSTHKAPMRMKRTSVLDPEGKVDTEKVEILFDTGAFPIFSRELLTRATIAAAGYYSIPNIRIEAKAVKTSTPPKNLYRGLGLSQSLFATETHFSRLAELAQHNPGEWKKEYAHTTTLPTGAKLRQIPLSTLLTRVMEYSDFHRKHAAYEQIKKRRSNVKTSRRYLRGIGISSGFTGNGFTLRANAKSTWNVVVRLDRKDQLTIFCGSTTIPDAIKRIWKNRAREILGISEENVEIAGGDTDTLPESGPMMLSSATGIYTNLIDRCCRQIKKQRFNSPLPLEVKKSLGSLKKGLWDDDKMTGNPFLSYSWGAVVVEVELDTLTLAPAIRGIWGVFDAGKVYNLEYAASIAENSIYEALAWSMGEEKFTPRYSQEYSLELDEQLSLRLPPVHVSFVDSEKGLPGGITPLAESLVPSAFVSSLCQATGAYFDRLPITPELIQNYLEER
ncbi:MAG: xanthine dehydrogenase family protein molybdopterin-binding subunit [Spirochaetaceae bacterium]